MTADLERKLALTELRLILEGLSPLEGDELFRGVARALARALRVRTTVIAELERPGVVRALALWSGDKFD